MPRVTKADLERENAKLLDELSHLRGELTQRRERSRSLRRKVRIVAAPMDATTRRALDVVRKHDRDGVVEEQRATIARLVQERTALIAKHAEEKDALEKGAGRMGPVLHNAWGGYPLPPDQLARILDNDESVVHTVMGTLEREFAWGPSLGRVMTSTSY